MTRYDRRTRLLATALAAVAGYVDAIGYLGTHGFFVSFMSGNSTRLAIGVAQGSPAAGFAASLIGCFVAGVMAGTLAGRLAGGWRRTAVLALVAALLALAAWLGGRAAILLIAAAMGAENTAFAEDGEVRIGLTYMTGALVKLGKRLAAALIGGDRWGWLPYLLLWLGLVGGAVGGANAYARAGIDALWGGAAAMAVLALIAARLGPDARDPAPAAG